MSWRELVLVVVTGGEQERDLVSAVLQGMQRKRSTFVGSCQLGALPGCCPSARL